MGYLLELNIKSRDLEMSNMLEIWWLKNLENTTFFGHFEKKNSRKKKHWCLFVGFLFLIQQIPLSRVQIKTNTMLIPHEFYRHALVNWLTKVARTFKLHHGYVEETHKDSQSRWNRIGDVMSMSPYCDIF